MRYEKTKIFSSSDFLPFYRLIEATPTPGGSISIADFSSLIDDLAAHIAAGDIDVVTQAIRDL